MPLRVFLFKQTNIEHLMLVKKVFTVLIKSKEKVCDFHASVIKNAYQEFIRI